MNANYKSLCQCGSVHASDNLEKCSNEIIERALLNSIFPNKNQRRIMLKALGLPALIGAIASVVPLDSLKAMALEPRGVVEKKNLKIGFVAITCATPLLMAGPLGVFNQQGISVTLQKTPGWQAIQDKVIRRELDASHFLSPMPLAMTLGLGGMDRVETSVATIQNTNGQAITLHQRHKNKIDPKSWKGMTFGVPFAYSMHNLLLRYFVSEHGLNPDTDIKIRIIPPPEMVSQLKNQDIDGFLGPDPFNQRAVFDGVGFIHTLSKDIWDGHPCCAFGATNEFIAKNPNTFAALYRSILNASVIVGVSSDREKIAKIISTPEFLNQPEEVVSQVLTGRFPDGLGNNKIVPERAQFDPIPWQSMAVWMLTQMKRWGYIKGDINYTKIAEKVFLLTNAKAQFENAGWKRPADGVNVKTVIMGRRFDATKPDDYENSFKIRSIV